MTGPIKKARKERELDGLVLGVLSSFRRQGAMQWTDWYETTTARRGERGLSTRTFSAVVKRLVANGQVQKDKDDCYRVVYDAVEDDAVNDASVNEPAAVDATANFTTIESEQCWKALLKGGNGNADIADIALQQLMDREFQDS
jgi:hypothetical protein